MLVKSVALSEELFFIIDLSQTTLPSLLHEALLSSAFDEPASERRSLASSKMECLTELTELLNPLVGSLVNPGL